MLRINSHCLVESVYEQNNISSATALQMCFEKLVLLNFEPDLEAEYTAL